MAAVESFPFRIPGLEEVLAAPFSTSARVYTSGNETNLTDITVFSLTFIETFIFESSKNISILIPNVLINCFVESTIIERLSQTIVSVSFSEFGITCPQVSKVFKLCCADRLNICEDSPVNTLSARRCSKRSRVAPKFISINSFKKIV